LCSADGSWREGGFGMRVYVFFICTPNSGSTSQSTEFLISGTSTLRRSFRMSVLTSAPWSTSISLGELRRAISQSNWRMARVYRKPVPGSRGISGLQGSCPRLRVQPLVSGSSERHVLCPRNENSGPPELVQHFRF
jgi:hypothetical protein